MTNPDTDEGGFASWFEKGKPIPVMHPIPGVYAEIYFPNPDAIEWRVYDYRTDEYTIEKFVLDGEESGEMETE
jgi:hypothetical protein